MEVIGKLSVRIPKPVVELVDQKLKYEILKALNGILLAIFWI